jgi:hypothetical protein
MIFGIEHSFDDLYNSMAKEKIFNQNTFIAILKRCSVLLIKDLQETAPDSLRNYANATTGNYSKSAENSRAKYGEMNKALGMYKSKIQGTIGIHSINVGYMPSKQKKAFVSNFLNYGWRSSNGHFNDKHIGFMQESEQRVLPAMKDVFDTQIQNTFEAEIAKKWANRRMRKVV